MRTSVQTTVQGELQTTLYGAMVNAHQIQIANMRKRIADAIEERRTEETKDGAELSKDFASLESWNDTDAVARLFIGLRVNPRVYVMSKFLPDADLQKAGFQPEARSRNLKAYKKVREVAEYVLHGGAKLEAVFKTWTACAILASKHTARIDRRVCEMFLSSLDIAQVSPDLADAVREFQAKHMSGGAQTQTSQMTLTLANLGAGTLVQDGRSKDFSLNRESALVHALAERFGLSAQLANVTPETVTPEADGATA